MGFLIFLPVILNQIVILPVEICFKTSLTFTTFLKITGIKETILNQYYAYFCSFENIILGLTKKLPNQYLAYLCSFERFLNRIKIWQRKFEI